MKRCPYCGHSNPVSATQCRKCEATFLPQTATLYKSHRYGPQKARSLRNKGLSAMALGLLITVYWGGYGPWPVIDTPPWAHMRPWLEPLLLGGGAVTYILGWVLHWF